MRIIYIEDNIPTKFILSLFEFCNFLHTYTCTLFTLIFIYLLIICRHETEHWHMYKKTDLSKVVYKRSKMKMKITLLNYKLS